MLAHTLYGFTYLLYYSAFLAIIAGHGYFYVQSFYRDDCYASMNIDDKLPYTAPGEGLKNVSQNFRVVNLMGLLTFINLFCLASWFQYTKSRYVNDSKAKYTMVSGLVWLSYYLTLITMVTRNAGFVCSGFYEPHARTFRFPLDSVYIKDNGLFLWYSMISQAGFFAVMFTGMVSF